MAWRPQVLGWWGSSLRMCGASAMGTASIVNFINQTAHVAMSENVIVRLATMLPIALMHGAGGIHQSVWLLHVILRLVASSLLSIQMQSPVSWAH